MWAEVLVTVPENVVVVSSEENHYRNHISPPSLLISVLFRPRRSLGLPVIGAEARTRRRTSFARVGLAKSR